MSSVTALKSAKLYTIGQVLGVLVPEFPDLTPSKLRFLEEQGLIAPSRTPSGYRKFSDSDVSRLRFILSLQRDKYLPLKVIRKRLAELDAGVPVSAEPAVSRSARRLSRIELMSETGITQQLLTEAIGVSLLAAEPYDQHALEVARAIMHLQRFGISPRHLRGLKAATDREVDIIQGVVAPVLRKNEAGSRSRAAHYAAEIENQFGVIRAELVRAAISRIDS